MCGLSWAAEIYEKKKRQQGFRDLFSSKIFSRRVSRLCLFSRCASFFFFFRFCLSVFTCYLLSHEVVSSVLSFLLLNLFVQQLNSKHHSSRLPRMPFFGPLLCPTCCRLIFFFFFLYSSLYMDNVWHRAMPFELQVKLWCYGVLRCSSPVPGEKTDWSLSLFPYSLKRINLVNSAMQIKTMKIFTKYVLDFLCMHLPFSREWRFGQRRTGTW